MLLEWEQRGTWLTGTSLDRVFRLCHRAQLISYRLIQLKAKRRRGSKIIETLGLRRTRLYHKASKILSRHTKLFSAIYGHSVTLLVRKGQHAMSTKIEIYP